MVQQNDHTNPDKPPKGGLGQNGREPRPDYFENDDDFSSAYDDEAVTKIYVDGNEYNSVDEIPPEVRDKMSETLLHVHEQSNNEDLSLAFKQQKRRRMTQPTMNFGGRREDLEVPPLKLGKIALIALGIVLVLTIVYIMLVS
jgi:hypothetical protein